MTSLQMIILGGFLLLLGVIIPFLMVMQVITPTLLLSFLSHISSVLGMALGLYGIFTYASTTRKH